MDWQDKQDKFNHVNPVNHVKELIFHQLESFMFIKSSLVIVLIMAIVSCFYAKKVSAQAVTDLKAGGTPRYTEYPGVNHYRWGNAYKEPDLANWLFGQVRGKSGVVEKK